MCIEEMFILNSTILKIPEEAFEMKQNNTRD